MTMPSCNMLENIMVVNMVLFVIWVLQRLYIYTLKKDLKKKKG